MNIILKELLDNNPFEYFEIRFCLLFHKYFGFYLLYNDDYNDKVSEEAAEEYSRLNLYLNPPLKPRSDEILESLPEYNESLEVLKNNLKTSSYNINIILAEFRHEVSLNLSRLTKNEEKIAYLSHIEKLLIDYIPKSNRQKLFKKLILDTEQYILNKNQVKPLLIEGFEMLFSQYEEFYLKIQEEITSLFKDIRKEKFDLNNQLIVLYYLSELGYFENINQALSSKYKRARFISTLFNRSYDNVLRNLRHFNEEYLSLQDRKEVAFFTKNRLLNILELAQKTGLKDIEEKIISDLKYFPEE